MFRKSRIHATATKKALISLTLVAFTVFAFGSMGGGSNKSKSKAVKTDFIPIRTTNGFTLKAGPSYHGSMIFGSDKKKNFTSFNSVITYQKGNTTYILPYRYKMQSASFQSKSSLELFNLKFKMHK